jgi:hypothetical protein
MDSLLTQTLAQSIQREFGLPAGSISNLESVIRNLQGWIGQTNDALELLDEQKHFHVVWLLQSNIQNYYRPALRDAEEKLRMIKSENLG